MNRIERHFRAVTMAERCRDLQGAATVIETQHGPGAHHFYMAALYLGKAAEELEKASSMDLETLLTLSIAGIRERKRCAEIGAETPGADAPTNVSPFSKSSL